MEEEIWEAGRQGIKTGRRAGGGAGRGGGEMERWCWDVVNCTWNGELVSGRTVEEEGREVNEMCEAVERGSQMRGEAQLKGRLGRVFKCL